MITFVGICACITLGAVVLSMMLTVCFFIREMFDEEN